MDYKKKKKKKRKKEKRKEEKKRNQNYNIPIPISTTKDVTRRSNGYNYHRLDYIKLHAAICQCQFHASCLRTSSIHRRKRQGSSRRDLQILQICNYYSFL